MEYTYNILDEVYFWMLSKQKNVEVRILKEKSEKIQVGDFIVFNNQGCTGQFIKVEVTDKKIFNNVGELLDVYDVNSIMPSHTDIDLKELLHKIYGEELNTKKLVAFKFKYLSSDKEDRNEKDD